MSYTIALAGNPNCGKTTLFNELTGSKQHVGNWPGVTVDKKEGTYRKDKEITILDLPGTYSLSPYSDEEIVARDYIVKDRPDAVINIVDGTSLERNLYLTVQLLETKIPFVVAINMMDEVKQRGEEINFDKLSKELGVPVVPIQARNRKGLAELMEAASKVAKNKILPSNKPILSDNIQNSVKEIAQILKNGSEAEKEWNAIKLLEGDEIVENILSDADKKNVEAIVSRVEKEEGDDAESVMADARYQFIGSVVKHSLKNRRSGHVDTTSDKMDRILTNRILAIPIFAAVMYLLFACTFSENFLFIPGLQSPGVWLAGIVETIWGTLTDGLNTILANAGASDWLLSLVIDGIMAGVGAVVGFIPLVLVLFLLLSFLEDSGYMARIAFVMDRIFRRFGLSGKAFIPLLMGFGCSVPALMASRTLESEKDRKITMMITPFMSCGAKVPIYCMFAATLFAGYNQTAIVFSVYMLGIVVAVLCALLLNKFAFKAEESTFIMELPQYRIPTLRSVLIHAWDKVKGFAIKAGTIIFGSTILIWLLSNFNFGGMCDMEDSFLASIGNAIKIIFLPLGFADWRASVGICTGWIAKENIVATFGQLFGGVTDDATIEAVMDGSSALPQIKSVFNGASAYAYMTFNLLCMPCFAAVGAIRREMGSLKWTLRTIAFQMGTAYVVSFIVYRIALLFM